MSTNVGRQLRFAWVGEDETEFDEDAHWVEAEIIEEFSLVHDEDKPCQLDIVVKNPGVGLLNPYRDRHAWLSWFNGTARESMFFGEVMAIPTDMSGVRVTLTLMSKPDDYEVQLQRLTDALKVLPGYDPVFLDVAHRDDPQAVLEGYPVVRHIDRITREVSLSDIIVGEDGIVVFQEDDVVPWNSLKVSVKEAPLKEIEMHADIKWTQRAEGVVNGGSYLIRTYTGDGIVSGWPKPLADLGGGWSVETSRVIDYYDIEKTITISWSNSWQNKEREHRNGDTMSISVSASDPVLHGQARFLRGQLTYEGQVGIFDPYNDPQVNIPAKVQETHMIVPEWLVEPEWTLRYKAERQRGETVKFKLKADLQELIGKFDTLIVKKSGADVGQPLINAEDREGMSGEVAVGTIILREGVYYVATTAGTLAEEPPEEFDELLGATTIDGTVVWTSLGERMFEEIPDWVANDFTPLGQIIHPKYPRVSHYTTLLPPSPPPTVGAAIAEGTVIRATNGSYHECTDGGTTGLVEPNFPTTRGSVTIDGTVEWTCLGMTLPVGSGGYQLAVQAGTTGSLIPIFNGVGENTTDGTVIWKNISNSPSFLAAPIGDPSRRSYFPIDRGLESLKYLICLARNQLLLRSRCIHITFQCKFERISELSLRKNAQVHSPLIPGGVAIGKIVNYKARVSGPQRQAFCEVTVAVCIGNGGAPAASAGEPEVWEGDVFEEDENVQASTGAIDLLTSGDIGFTPPRDEPQDDGIVFPITDPRTFIERDIVRGDLIAQRDAINLAFRSESEIANLPPPGSPYQAIENAKKLIELNKHNMDEAFKENPIWLDLALKPVSGSGPFELLYKVPVTLLHVPRNIDLGAE